MVKKLNLTPVRKAELKKNVLNALEHGQPKAKKVFKLITAPKAIIKPLAVKPLAIKPAIATVQKPINSLIDLTVKKPVIIKKPIIKKNASAGKKLAAKKSAVSKKISAKEPLKLEIKKLTSSVKTAQTKPTLDSFKINWDSFNSGKEKKPLFKPFSLAKQPVQTSRHWEKAIDKKEDSLEKLFQKTNKALAAKNDPWSAIPVKPLKAGRKFKINWWRLVIISVVALILVLLFDVVGIYKLGFKDSFSYQVAKAFMLPAGQVSGANISLADYYDDLRLLPASLTQKREGLPDLSKWQDMSDKVFYRLAANALVRQRLASYKKPVIEETVNQQINSLISQSGSAQAIEKTVKDFYGLNLAQFKSKILWPMLEREALQEIIISDDSVALTKAAKDKANNVLQMALNKEVDFATLAAQSSDDEATVNIGGDLGWVVKGQLDPRWEDSLFSVATGTVYDQLITSKFGYHIVKVEQKLTDKDTGQQSIKLRHILIKVDVNQYIKDELDRVGVKKYVR